MCTTKPGSCSINSCLRHSRLLAFPFIDRRGASLHGHASRFLKIHLAYGIHTLHVHKHDLPEVLLLLHNTIQTRFIQQKEFFTVWFLIFFRWSSNSPVSGHALPPCSSAGVMRSHAHPSFYVGAEGLNSGPHVCRVSARSHWATPHALQHILNLPIWSEWVYWDITLPEGQELLCMCGSVFLENPTKTRSFPFSDAPPSRAS